jgi:peptide/nickel transport system ATP-binding protein
VTAPVLDVDHLTVTFRSGGFLRPTRVVRAVDDVGFALDERETLGLVGESGSGKSTTGRAILRLVKADAGHVVVAGKDITEMGRRELRQARRDMQMVFQDPYSSLDPSMVVGDSVGEPLEVYEGLRGKERDRRVTELLEVVGLSRHHVERYPYEFSGGQRQRIAIARAIALNPKLVVCDEAVSALDVSTRNQIINLLERLRDEFGMAYLFIAHDLSVVRHISQRVAVMYLGRLVELGPTARVYERAAHPYTEALLSAIPVPNPKRARTQQRLVLEGDIPDPAAVPPGCAFHTRCPYVMDVCREVVPQPTLVDGGGTVACHLQTSGPTLRGAPLVERHRRPTADSRA